jgi:cytochrome oxidase Cu insertion factor (SCO1/SenC/PrrC family)
MRRLTTLVALGLLLLGGLWLTGRREAPPPAEPRIDSATPAESGLELGPHDGTTLPPVDTGRVALGDTAPDFTLLSRSGDPVTLSDYRGERTVLLVFYRGHW